MKLLLLALPVLLLLVVGVAMFSTPHATQNLQTVDIPLQSLLPAAKQPGA